MVGSITFDGVEFPITAFDCTVKNNLKPLDDEAFQDFPDCVIPMYREVTGTVKVRARRDVLIHHANRYAYGQRAITVVMGTGGLGSQFTISIPQAELDFAAVEVPESGFMRA